MVAPPVVKPLTDLKIGGILRRTSLVFAQSFFPLAGIAGIAFLFGFVVPSQRDGYAPVDLGLPMTVANSIFLTCILLGQSAMCVVAFQHLRGQRIGLGEALNIGLRRSLPLVGIVLISLVILKLLLSLSVAVTVGIVLLPMWSMVMPICVIERLDPLRSFSRGQALTKGHRGKMLGLILLVIVAGMALLTTVPLLVRTILLLGPHALVGPVARLNGLTWMALWTVFFAVLLAVCYHELRADEGRIKPGQIVEVFE
jgi:hypothetical protein